MAATKCLGDLGRFGQHQMVLHPVQDGHGTSSPCLLRLACSPGTQQAPEDRPARPVLDDSLLEAGTGDAWGPHLCGGYVGHHERL